MKTQLFLVTFLLANLFAFSQYTAIPDTNFENALSSYDDIANDGQVPTANINTITELFIYNENIDDLTGIQDFAALTLLDCNDNNLTSLDISNNTALTKLYCNFNSLTSLDISNNLLLTYLDFSNNGITNIDVSNHNLLTELICSNNSLTNLDVLNNTELTSLTCGINPLTNIDISNNVNLIYFSCSEIGATVLDVSNNTALLELLCGNNSLTSLDLSNNINLVHLNFINNQITSLDLLNHTFLYQLVSAENPLTSLDLSNAPNLSVLLCDSSELTTLDLRNGNNTSLLILSAFNNPDLTCIFVDDADFSNTNWVLPFFEIDATSTYVNDQAACDVVATDDFLLENTISIYPTPTENTLFIDTKTKGTYEIYTISGMIIKKGVFETGLNTINTKLINEGVYFIRFESDNKIFTKKILIK